MSEKDFHKLQKISVYKKESHKMHQHELFQDELDELEKVYNATLNELNEKVRDEMPTFLFYMESFVAKMKKIELIKQKLENLNAKIQSEELDDSSMEE